MSLFEGGVRGPCAVITPRERQYPLAGRACRGKSGIGEPARFASAPARLIRSPVSLSALYTGFRSLIKRWIQRDGDPSKGAIFFKKGARGEGDEKRPAAGRYAHIALM